MFIWVSDFLKANTLLRSFFMISIIIGIFLGVGAIEKNHLFSDQLYFLYITQEYYPSIPTIYHHLVELNAPTIFAYNLPTIWLSSVISIAIEHSFLIQTLVVIIAIAYSSLKLLLKSEITISRNSYLFISLITFFSLMAGINFGQRDQLAFLFLLPYIFTTINLIQNKPIRTSTLLISGLAATFAISLKFHYLLIIIISNGLLIAYQRRAIHQHLHLISVVFFLSILSIFYYSFIPQYIEYLLLGFKTYSGYSTPAPLLLRSETFILIPLLIYILYFRNKTRIIAAVYLVSFWLMGTLQTKGFQSHFYPFTTVAASIIVTLIFSHLINISTRKHQFFHYLSSFIIIALTLSYGLFGLYLSYTSFLSINAPEYQHFSQQLAKHAQNKSIAVLTTSLYPTVYAAYENNIHWASRYKNFWMLPGFYTQQTDQLNYHNFNQMSPDEFKFLNNILQDLEQQTPYLLLIDNAEHKTGFNRHFDYYQYFHQSPRFQKILNNYSRTEDIHNFHAYTYNTNN